MSDLTEAEKQANRRSWDDAMRRAKDAAAEAYRASRQFGVWWDEYVAAEVAAGRLTPYSAGKLTSSAWRAWSNAADAAQPIPIPTHANHVHANVVELLEEYLERARRGEVYAISLVVTDGPPSTTVETRHGRVVGDTCSARVLASALRTRARELEELEGEPDG